MSEPASDAIAAFYDEHPYPPPLEDLDRERSTWRDGRRRRIEHARLWPHLPHRDDPTILVAGCGTSQAARYAVRYPNAKVIGIDVSPTSLDRTRRLADRHGLDHLDVHLLAIEEVAQLGLQFDHVVCTGVLHHLADPGAGLRALRSVLAPGGALVLMVYARYGRTGVEMIRDYGRLLGLSPAADDVSELVATLRELPTGHPLSHLLRRTPDFGDRDALADALLNPRERSYSVPDVHHLLDSSGLRFHRWVRQAPYVARCGVIRNLPHGPRLAALPAPEQAAAMELFRGTMTRHSFVATRADEPPVEVGWDRWCDLVPIRTASAVAIRDRVPDAAAALLNRAHTDTDLVLLVDERQLASFEQIDGTTRIGELPEPDRAFFEQLWWHDLIVVDASGGSVS